MIVKELSPETRRIADLLVSASRGQTITFREMSIAIGRDIKTTRHTITRALRVAEREAGAVFAGERGTGYRRLTPQELEQIGKTSRSRIRSTARRGTRAILAGLEGANDIEPDSHRKVLAELSALGLLEHIARNRSVPEVFGDDMKPLTVAETAKAFMTKIGAI